ncbi:MAG: amidohydrolase [Leucothrix sp.]
MNTIYNAKKIITMNPQRPHATHVAVRDGRILGAGTLDELTGWGDYQLDERFADKVIMPGFVEGHSHAMEGTLWDNTYVGYFDRMDPDGKVWSGVKSIPEVIERLKSVDLTMTGVDAPLPGWQLDPIYFDNERMTREHLDQVSATRPVGVLHASGHIVNVNSKALELAGLLRTGIDNPGVPLGTDGLPTGELKGPEVMGLVSLYVGFDQDFLACDEPGLINFGKLCVRSGVTTATDLASRLAPDTVDMMHEVISKDDYPTRIVSLLFHGGVSPEALISRAQTLKTMSTDKLRLGKIKVVADGSIQGFSARMREPGYYNGAPNGLWYISPEHLEQILSDSLENDLHVHIHTNGDEATELLLDTMDKCLIKQPARDHRFTIQHCQLADSAQFRRMSKLGLCVNLFANHHFYWGDEHYKLTVGPERALRMNACATALENNVPMAIHSDAPVTPLGPLFTAWCAVNRLTASGRVQGEAEKISLDDALYAITLGAAYTLKMDSEVGSIETGKRADFAILEDDPETVGADKVKDVTVWGTVLAGKVFAASELS